ncbi:MAG: hypothetical protein K6T83_21545 [Alicyclobacillus sp.]|nr:hypothetical protein [Alicyclobacillus sp.]
MSNVAALIDAYLTVPDAPIAAECEQCGSELYEGDDVVLCEGVIFCSDDCLMRYLVDGGAVRRDTLGGDS